MARSGRGTVTSLAMVLAAAAVLMAGAPTVFAQASPGEEAWDALAQGGNVVLMRHAIAPGGGDPPGFRLDDCATQRNLSEEGRAQARRIGRMRVDRG